MVVVSAHERREGVVGVVVADADAGAGPDGDPRRRGRHQVAAAVRHHVPQHAAVARRRVGRPDQVGQDFLAAQRRLRLRGVRQGSWAVPEGVVREFG